MSAMDYFEREEFIFPDQGGVTGTRVVECPNCSAAYELEVDVGNTEDAYQCANCSKAFVVNWVDDSVVG